MTLRGALAGLAGIVLLYLLALAWLWRNQESLLFLPERLPADHRFEVAGAEEVSVSVPGARLSALHLRLANPKGLVFYLHGNGGNLAGWFANADFYRDLGYDLFMVDYRGYGKSTGRIESEEQLMADVRAAWVAVSGNYQGRRIVVFGRSLGTALAARLAAEVRPDLTVLASPYCSMADLARHHYPWVPTALLRYPLSTCEAASRMTTPLLLLHGDRDAVIPASQAESLRARAPGAELHLVRGAGHDDIHLFPDYLDALRARLRAL
ncbi:MAG TPA: alpha/beta fold hydrolase [Rhodocyclaceae bacterium]|nr:alpha/beta fold hydrolase [Rhodocyclaceae bacterium]